MKAPSDYDSFLHYLNDGAPVFGGQSFAGREGARLRTLFAFVTGGPDSAARARAAAAYRGKRATEDGTRADAVLVPLDLRKDVDMVLAGQQTSLTAVVARYLAAHVQISVAADPSLCGGRAAASAEEAAPGSVPLEGGLSEEEARERAVLRRFLPGADSSEGGNTGSGSVGATDPERAFAGVFRGAEAQAPLEGRGGRRLAEAFRFVTGERRIDRRSGLETKTTGFRLPGLLAEAAKAVERRQEPTLTELVTRYFALHEYLSRPAQPPHGHAPRARFG